MLLNMIPNRLTYPLHPIIYMYISNQYTYIYIVSSNSIIYPRTTNINLPTSKCLMIWGWSLSLPPTKRQTTNDKRQWHGRLLGSKLLVFKMMGTTRASLSGEVFKTTKRVDCWVMLSLPHDIPSYLVLFQQQTDLVFCYIVTEKGLRSRLRAVKW